MNCPKCNNNLNESSRFCSQCGVEINEAATKSLGSDVPVAVDEIEQNKNTFKSSDIFSILGALGVIAIFVYYLYGSFLAPIPKIIVAGENAANVEFTNWKHDGKNYTGRMLYKGGYVNSILATSYGKNGIKIRDFTVTHPDLKTGESCIVTLINIESERAKAFKIFVN